MFNYIIEYNKLLKKIKKLEEVNKANKILHKENEQLKNKIEKLKKKDFNIEKLKKKDFNKGIRNSKEYREFRNKIIKRDDNKCVKCGYTKKLQVHHIKPTSKYPELIMKEDNAITLCIKCHSETDGFFSTTKKG